MIPVMNYPLFRVNIQQILATSITISALNPNLVPSALEVAYSGFVL
jgi:hypothetical protein